MKTFLVAAGVVLSTAGSLLLWFFVRSISRKNSNEVLQGKGVVFEVSEVTDEYRKTVVTCPACSDSQVRVPHPISGAKACLMRVSGAPTFSRHRVT